MEVEKKIELLKYLISRFDSYYNGVNAKIGFYLALNTFLILGTGTTFSLLKDQVPIGPKIVWLLITVVVLSLLNIAILLIAMHPFLTSGNSKKYTSLTFFGSISEMKENEFCSEFDSRSIDETYADLRNQTYQLARGLSGKFRSIHVVGRLMLIQFLIIAIIVIALLTN